MIHGGFLNLTVNVFYFFCAAQQEILDSIRGNVTHQTGTTVLFKNKTSTIICELKHYSNKVILQTLGFN